MLDAIIDEIGGDETHPLADPAEALALFIHSYEETHAKIREATRWNESRSFTIIMEAHGLTQSELPEIGSQRVVSEILSSRTRTQYSTDSPPSQAIRSLRWRLHCFMRLKSGR